MLDSMYNAEFQWLKCSITACAVLWKLMLSAHRVCVHWNLIYFHYNHATCGNTNWVEKRTYLEDNTARQSVQCQSHWQTILFSWAVAFLKSCEDRIVELIIWRTNLLFHLWSTQIKTCAWHMICYNKNQHLQCSLLFTLEKMICLYRFLWGDRASKYCIMVNPFFISY